MTGAISFTVWLWLLDRELIRGLVFSAADLTDFLLTELLLVALSGPFIELNLVGGLRLLLIEPPENRI
jgi:hypothetical protein